MATEERELPDLELLCYSSARPMLRVVNPSLGVERGFGLMKSAGQAVDLAVPREGWVAAWAGATYRLPLGPNAKAKSLPRGQKFVAAADRRCVWVPHGAAGAWAEYDGVADQVVRVVDVGHDYLVGAVSRGLVVQAVTGDRGYLVDPGGTGVLRELIAAAPSARAPEFVGCVDDTIVWSGSPASLLVQNVGTGEVDEVRLPLWRRDVRVLGPPSFSPDGRWLALTGDAIVGKVPLDLPRSERERRKQRGSALVLVDLAQRRADLVEDYFEGFGYAPVWSTDGDWVFVGVPFERAIYALSLHSDDRQLLPVRGDWRSAAMPLLDLAAAATRGTHSNVVTPQ